MDFQTIVGILFIAFFAVFLYLKRKNVQVQGMFPFLYVVLYRARWGLGLMQRLGSRFPVFFRRLGDIGTAIGILGMIAISYEVIANTILLFTRPDQAPALQPVLPIPITGVFFVPFVYWIASIFIIAVVHEFAHGVIARAWNVKVKSSGFAFFGIIAPLIPAAFVEPDEKVVAKATPRTQLGIFAAGPFSNILLALFVILLFGFAIPPFVPESVTQHTSIVNLGGQLPELLAIDYLQITNVTPGSPAARAGLMTGMNITAINAVVLAQSSLSVLNKELDRLSPGQTIVLTTNEGPTAFPLGQHPDDATTGYMGLGFSTPKSHPSIAAIERYGETGIDIILALATLLIWVFTLSLGIGLFNLLPLGPIDGGRMLKTILEKYLPSSVARKIWIGVGVVFLAAIIINLGIGFVR